MFIVNDKLTVICQCLNVCTITLGRMAHFFLIVNELRVTRSLETAVKLRKKRNQTTKQAVCAFIKFNQVEEIAVIGISEHRLRFAIATLP